MLTRPQAVLSGRSWRAFTLIELLVVISIIAILIGILLPALAAARKHARMSRELVAARTCTQAYMGQSFDNKGHFMLGYLGAGDLATHPPVYSAADNVTVGGEPLNRYPWRLVQYLDQSIRGSILVNEQQDLLGGGDRSGYPSWEYAVSIVPSLGINAVYMGGRASQSYRHEVGSSPRWSPSVLRRLEDSPKPSQQIVFGSGGGVMLGKTVYGYYELTAPTGLPNDYGTATPWSTSTGDGNIHYRWSGRAVFSQLDGHAKLMEQDQARDMRLWSRTAQNNDDPNQPPPLTVN